MTEIESPSQSQTHDTEKLSTQIPDQTPTPVTTSSAPKDATFTYPKDQPIETIMGGAPIRQWINKHLTQAVLDGMRHVAKERPEDPVRVLGEYLIKWSEENKQTTLQQSNSSKLNQSKEIEVSQLDIKKQDKLTKDQESSDVTEPEVQPKHTENTPVEESEQSVGQQIKQVEIAHAPSPSVSETQDVEMN